MSQQCRAVLAQGDLVIRRATTVPTEATPVAPIAGRHVLALGEVTGHHHSVPAGMGTLVRDARTDVMYLTVDQLTQVTHQEHAPITLEPGVYEIRRQREATDDDESWQNVAD